jgi:hypothetical protein
MSIVASPGHALGMRGSYRPTIQAAITEYWSRDRLSKAAGRAEAAASARGSRSVGARLDLRLDDRRDDQLGDPHAARDLESCTDVDFGFSPATNLMPAKRVMTAPAGVLEYSFLGAKARVEYFLAEFTREAGPPEDGRSRAWFELDEALERLNYKNTRKLLRKAWRLLMG